MNYIQTTNTLDSQKLTYSLALEMSAILTHPSPWTDTQLNYPPGILQTVSMDLGEHGWFSLSFFPENYGERKRTLSHMIDRSEIEEMLEWQKIDLKEMWLIDEVAAWETEDGTLGCLDCPYFEEAEEAWIDFNTIDEEAEKMFEKLEQEVELHTLRARAGPPSGEYYMRTNIGNGTDCWHCGPLLGHPISFRGSWTYDDWCPEMGRTSIISYPEDYGCFDSFNTSFMEVPIMWGVSPKWGFYELTSDSQYEECFKPRNISSYLDRVLPEDTPKDHPWLRWGNGDRKGFLPPNCKDRYLDDLEKWKLDDLNGLKRFTGLRSCGGWMEDQLDNEGRFVCDGTVVFVVNRGHKYTIIKTKYGECVLNNRTDLEPNEKVKILCRGNDLTEPWLIHLKIKCTKVFPKHLWEKGGVVVDGYQC